MKNCLLFLLPSFSLPSSWAEEEAAKSTLGCKWASGRTYYFTLIPETSLFWHNARLLYRFIQDWLQILKLTLRMGEGPLACERGLSNTRNVLDRFTTELQKLCRVRLACRYGLFYGIKSKLVKVFYFWTLSPGFARHLLLLYSHLCHPSKLNIKSKRWLCLFLPKWTGLNWLG